MSRANPHDCYEAGGDLTPMMPAVKLTTALQLAEIESIDTRRKAAYKIVREQHIFADGKWGLRPGSCVTAVRLALCAAACRDG